MHAQVWRVHREAEATVYTNLPVHCSSLYSPVCWYFSTLRLQCLIWLSKMGVLPLLVGLTCALPPPSASEDWKSAGFFFFFFGKFCPSIQGLHPSEEHLKANYVTTPREGCPNSKAPPNAGHKCGLLLPVTGGCTATILRGLTYPKILCVPEEEHEIKK